MQTLTQQNTKSEVKLWYPRQVLFTADALKHEHTQKIYERIKNIGIAIIESPANRITGIKGSTDAETYRNAKSTLAIIKSTDSMFKLQPIPPSADYQFHLAQGCPAHCQYCYLAGSLQGAPVVKAYGNLNEILENTRNYESSESIKSFEVSCYTDPLSLEHLTGSLSECIRHFSTRNAHLRWVTKFDDVDALLQINHQSKTRCRFSVNAEDIAQKFEAGTASLTNRLIAAQKLSSAEDNLFSPYPIGFVVAPIMPVEDWRKHYDALFQKMRSYIFTDADLTFEFITHRFTPTSKSILENWYPASKLNMAEEDRSLKFNKFGGVKYVYKNVLMKEMKTFFQNAVATYFPNASVLYWT